MAFLLNMFIDIENENNDPYYHENLNDNIDLMQILKIL